ncbi:MAG: transposase [Deltaproteobacteria bacterium]|nr:transposase [Deltaproteobacteria bacterium]
MAIYSPYIKRAEARELAQCYVVGLMMDGDRKSVEPMSEKVHASERGMQRLLTEVKWDHDGAFGEYRRRMLAETADPQGVLVIDDTGFPKKGRHSVCVVRQYCGSLGKVDNCQVGVSLTYVGQEFAWPYARWSFLFLRAGTISMSLDVWICVRRPTCRRMSIAGRSGRWPWI